MNYDAIVIGAGNGGLATAATFAKKGKKVIVFEKHNVPGGCGTSFRRGRFEFEVALHQLSAMGSKEKPGELRLLFRELGIEDKIEWIEINSLYKINLPGNKGVSLPADRVEVVKHLSKIFPKDKENIQRYYDLVWKFNMETLDFIAKSNNGNKKEPGFLKKMMVKTFFPKKYPTIAKYGLKTSEEVLNEFFPDNKELQLCLSAYWCFMGMPPTKFPFTILARCTYIYITDKPYYLVGGSQMISQALANVIVENGGKINYSCGVKKILVEKNTAVGVVDEFGNKYYAQKIVSNISPINTYADLMEEHEIPKAAREYLKGYTPGISALTCFIGLDCPPEEIGFTDSFNLIYETLDPAKSFENATSVEVTNEPLVATCYTVDDPTVSPKGTSVITAGSLKYGEPWEKLSPEEYYEKKYEAAQKIVDRLELRFPGISKHIEELTVATPLTHLRYLNSPHGSIYGYEQDLKQSVYFFPQETFVKNLDFASGWVNICGFGPNYLYGYKKALSLLKEMK